MSYAIKTVHFAPVAEIAITGNGNNQPGMMAGKKWSNAERLHLFFVVLNSLDILSHQKR